MAHFSNRSFQVGFFAFLVLVQAIATNAWAEGREVLVTTTAELVAAMNPQNAGKTIRVMPGVYCPKSPLTLPEGSRVLGAGKMKIEAGLPIEFSEGTVTEIVPADGGIRCPAEQGKFSGGSVLNLSDRSSLHGVKISIDLSAGYTPAFAGNTVMVQAKGAEVIRASISNCDIQARTGIAGPSPGVPGGRALSFTTGAAPNNHDLPGDPKISVTLSRSIIRGNGPTGGVVLFAINFESGGKIFLSLDHNFFKETGTSLDLAGAASRNLFDVPIIVEDAVTEVFSIGNLYQGLGSTSTGWGLTAGATTTAAESPDANNNTLLFTSINDRIENVGKGLNARAALRRNSGPGRLNDNTMDLQLIGTQFSVLESEGNADLIFCPVQVQVPGVQIDKVGDRNWIFFSAVGMEGSGTRDNLYEYDPAVCGNMESTGEENGITFWGSLDLWNILNQNIDPDPPAELFSF